MTEDQKKAEWMVTAMLGWLPYFKREDIATPENIQSMFYAATFSVGPLHQQVMILNNLKRR